MDPRVTGEELIKNHVKNILIMSLKERPVVLVTASSCCMMGAGSCLQDQVMKAHLK
jgi:hypothetical protein